MDAKARLEAIEAIFSALAHPARRQILLAIKFRGGSMTAGDVVGRFNCAWPTITRHLRVLEKAGLVEHETQGRTRLYRLNEGRVEIAKDWLSWFNKPESE
jgi:DNA-binding transcriptional ArsR family regulator